MRSGDDATTSDFSGSRCCVFATGKIVLAFFRQFPEPPGEIDVIAEVGSFADFSDWQRSEP